jgi:hypothetical protein
LKLSLVTAPPYVSLGDNGNGSGALKIAPALSESADGRVTVKVTDTGGLSAETSFNIVVTPRLMITGVSYEKPQLLINGFGFDTQQVVVDLNGQNISPFIKSQSDSAIILKGKRKKLGIKRGQNQVTVTINGLVSNTFVFNFVP